MRRALVILVSIVVFATIVVAIAPASLAGVALVRASGGAVGLTATEGTFWRGRGTIIATGDVRIPVAWSVDPWPLLRGELRLRLSPPAAGSTSPHADIVARHGAVAIRELDVSLAADGFAALAPRSGLRLAGDVRVTAPSLDWTPQALAGSARIDWQDVQFKIFTDPALRLGTIQATLAAAGDRLEGPVGNNGGAFDVRGTLSLAASGAANVAITMTPRTGDAAQPRTLTISTAPGVNPRVEFGVRLP